MRGFLFLVRCSLVINHSLKKKLLSDNGRVFLFGLYHL